MVRIDAHQHFWHPARGDYHWMPQDNDVLSRPYDPSHLRPEIARHGITNTVLVQAAATVTETDYLLGIADATSEVAGVVGWVDFENAGDAETLARLAKHPKFLGVRPMIQDIPDDDWMLRDNVQWGYRSVNDLDLTFDALGFPRHLANFLTILTRYPDMRVVIDHCMKPPIRDHSEDTFRFWADGMARIAAETGAFCKLSGIVTEAAEDWTVADLRPYANHVLEAFGPNRVMWGSDWPVCRLHSEYDRWQAAAEDLTQSLTNEECAQIFGRTAAAFYRLDV